MEKMIGAMREVFDRDDGEQLVAGTIEQRALERFFGTDDGVSVVDGGDDVAFGGEIFREVAEEDPRARISMRDDDERESFPCDWRGITKSFAGVSERFGSG